MNLITKQKAFAKLLPRLIDKAAEKNTMPAIVVKGTDIKNGFWGSFQKLMHDEALPFTVKVRVKSIFNEINKQTRDLQDKYNEEVSKIKWEGEGPNKKCLEPEKAKALDEEFMKFEIMVPGKRLKASSLENSSLTASDLHVIDMLIEGK